ncbi:hypothetical protein [Candidatus Nitrotoga sp. AM1P]|nr:hypothetical protein [Candidatus Nitrotoga sp. AM1P]
MAVLSNDKAIASVLAAPTHCIALNLWADITGRDHQKKTKQQKNFAQI